MIPDYRAFGVCAYRFHNSGAFGIWEPSGKLKEGKIIKQHKHDSECTQYAMHVTWAQCNRLTLCIHCFQAAVDADD